MSARSTFIGASLSAAVLVLAIAGPAAANDDNHDHDHDGHHAAFQQVNLVADLPGVAATTDPDLVNPWGLSRGPNTPVWVSDNGSDVTTVYRTDVAGSPVTKALSVAIPGGAPTGQVFNDTTSFVVPGTGQPARFIFIGEDGDLSAWNGASVRHQPSGTSTARSTRASRSCTPLRAGPARRQLPRQPDRHVRRVVRARSDGTVDVPRPVPAQGLRAVQRRRDQRPGLRDVREAGRGRRRRRRRPGHGFVDVYSDAGRFVQRFATRGALDSPWGLAVAPAIVRQPSPVTCWSATSVTVASTPSTCRAGSPRGTLRGTDGRPLTIDGLWGLMVGDAVAGGADSVWFSAGPDDEAHGLLGLLKAAP